MIFIYINCSIVALNVMPYESECPSKDVSSGSVVRILPLSVQVPFLVGELRPHMLCRKKKQKTNNNKKTQKTETVL